MKRSLLLFSLMLTGCCAMAQGKGYKDSIEKFQKQYVDSHEVVKGADRQYFKFFPVHLEYRVLAAFERIHDTSGFIMKTSGKEPKKYYRYGIASFVIDNRPLHLTVYQSEQLMKDPLYKDYLFIPYTDLTSGDKSYGGGKYIDFVVDDIKNNSLIIDFNKSYNPYCAYASGYNCPIPPAANDLNVEINAGEMDFAKQH